ncbi:MAG: LapA family protein, partial [Mycobacterium sp.]
MTSDPSASPGRTEGATPPHRGEPVPPPLVDLPEVPAEPAPRPQSAVHFTRAAALWSALIVGFLILILLLVFIMQNTNSITINFFGWNWNLPLGVAILLSAVGGGLLTVAVGTA